MSEPVDDTLPAGIDSALPRYVAAQRWFGGRAAGTLGSVEVEWGDRIWVDGSGARALWHSVVRAGADRYQLFIGERPAGEPADFLHGHDEATIGAFGHSYFYDATLDADMAKVLLEVASGGDESAKVARPISAEQSNTSLVYDDRIILKLFRKLHEGRNPDVEITTTLADSGFEHVADPMVIWRERGYDLAFGQKFLAGGSEGWALALTSLRDLYNSEGVAPGDAGGDFGAEARRLGTMTAEMHLALRIGFGVATAADSRTAWRDMVDGFARRLQTASEIAGRDLAGPAEPLLKRLGEVADPGPFLRVHGDYHLGQVMRTDAGWYVLDFEGEPGRALAERLDHCSPFKDVSSMLRSFHYATRHALTEHTHTGDARIVGLAEAWDAHNRQAFLDGYRRAPGISALLPPVEAAPAVLLAYELDKALYELGYEMAHRPDWVSIPLDALHRLLHEGEDVAG